MLRQCSITSRRRVTSKDTPRLGLHQDLGGGTDISLVQQEETQLTKGGGWGALRGKDREL